MSKYTKAIIAFAGVLLPFLESVGVMLPEFLTVDWLQGIILAVTPALVFYFPNKNSDGSAAVVRSPAVVGILAGLLSVMVLSGCAGTTSAYRAADGAKETANVMGEYYFALVREANILAEEGLLTGTNLSRAQNLVRDIDPLIEELTNAAQAYERVQNAETQEELSSAINNAALALSRLVNAIKAAGGSANLTEPIELSLAHI